MENSEVYSFFKMRKHQFEEAPSKDLWTKIEAALDAPPTYGTNPWPIKNIMLATIILVTMAGIFSLIYKSQPIDKPALKSQPDHHIIKPDTAPVETLIEEKIHKLVVRRTYIEVAGDSVKKRKRIVKPNEAPAAYIPFTRIMPEAEIAQRDTAGFNVDNLPTTTKTGPNRVVVDTKIKLTKSQFDDFVAKVMEENKDAAGSMITIKAPGHKLFRQLIKAPKQDIQPISGKLNERMINKSIYIMNQQDTIVPESNTLKEEPVYLQFQPINKDE